MEKPVNRSDLVALQIHHQIPHGPVMKWSRPKNLSSCLGQLPGKSNLTQIPAAY
jgi:hypothetical protein